MSRPFPLCLPILLACACAAWAQTPPPRRTPPARQPPATKVPAPAQAKAITPARPAGSKPITLKTAQAETVRLSETITRLEKQLAARAAEGKGGSGALNEAGAAAEPAADNAAADTKADKDAKKEKATLASVERENASLRRKADRLLVLLAEAEGRVPERPAHLPPYDPKVIDSPVNAEFCPGKTMEQLENTMRYAGTPIAEVGDEVVYEWVFYLTNAKRSAHVAQHVWAQMKGDVASNTMSGPQEPRKEGPPPKNPVIEALRASRD